MATTKISSHVIEGGAITASHLSNVTTAHVTEGSNLYHTTARARGSVSVTGGFLSYDSGTGVLSHDTTPTFSSIDSGNITSTGTINMNHDGATLFLGADIDMRMLHDGSNGTIRSDTGNLLLDVAGGITLDANGGQVDFKDNGVLKSLIDFTGNNVEIQSRVTDGDMLFRGQDGSSFITALTLDMSDAGSATFNNNVTIGGNLTINGTTTTINSTTLDVDDLNITVAKGSGSSAAADGAGLTIDGPGASMTWDHGNQYFEFNQAVFSPTGYFVGTTGTKVGHLQNSAGTFLMEAQSTRQIAFGNETNGEFVRIDADGKLLIGTSTSLHGSADLQIQAASGNYARIMLKDQDGTTQHAFIDKSGADFAITSQNGTAHGTIGLKQYNGTDTLTRLHINAAGNTGIGTTSPSELLHVKGTNGAIAIDGNGSSNTASISFINDNERSRITSAYDSGGGGRLTFHTDTTGGSLVERLRINNAGDVGIGTSSPAKKLHIYDATQTNQSIRFGNPAAAPYGEINYNSTGLEHLYIDSHGTTTGYGNIVFRTGPDPAEVMRIAANGKVGIGTDNPTALLEINGKDDALGSTELLRLLFDNSPADTGMTMADINGTVKNRISMDAGNTADLRISAGTQIGFYTNTSNGTGTPTVLIHNDGYLDVAKHIEVGSTTEDSSINGGLVLETPQYREYHFNWSGLTNHQVELTCTSYFMAIVEYMTFQTNGGADIQEYHRGKWANNHTTHTWDEFESSGNTGAISNTITAGQNNISNSGKLTIAETYGSGSYSGSSLIVKVYFGDGGFGISKTT